MTLSAATRVVGIIGSPVRHSLSPAMHNAAFAACGIDCVYLAFDVERGRAGAAIDAVRTLGLVGLSVTMPHKADAAGAVDEVAAAAAALDAVNTIVVDDTGRLIGHNTDGPGFIASLALDAGVEPDGLRCVVIGAGGAARAIVLALGWAGAADISVVNRTEHRATAAARLAGAAGRVGSPADVDAADLVVNATPIGMAGDTGLPIDAGRLHRGQVVVDLVYEPSSTPLLAAARAVGATPVTGIGMLVHQAALQFRLWTNVDAPLAVMRSAAEQQLKSRP